MNVSKLSYFCWCFLIIYYILKVNAHLELDKEFDPTVKESVKSTYILQNDPPLASLSRKKVATFALKIHLSCLRGHISKSNLP